MDVWACNVVHAWPTNPLRIRSCGKGGIASMAGFAAHKTVFAGGLLSVIKRQGVFSAALTALLGTQTFQPIQD